MGSLENLYRYFEHFTTLRAELLETLEDWDTPTIVVFGPQNAGKSTLLERLAMMPLFPKGNGLCTRVPIRIRMRTGDEKTILKTINIESHGKELESDRTEIKKSENISVRVNQIMLNLLKQLNKKTKGIRSDRLIEVEISRLNLPNIDLLDLPGMVINPDTHDDPDLADQTYRLVINSLKAIEGRAIYLAVSEASLDPQQSLTFKVLRELPHIQKDCFGVLTKSDDPKDEKLVEYLKKSKGLDLGYSYFAVMNDPKYTKLEEIAKRELEFFQENDLRKKILNDKQAGCDVLLEKLSVGYGNYLRENWAYETFDLLRLKKEKTEADIQDLGPFFDDHQVDAFKEILKKCLSEVLNIVLGNHIQMVVKTLKAMDLSKFFSDQGFMHDSAKKQWKMKLDAFSKVTHLHQDIHQHVVNETRSIVSKILKSMSDDVTEKLHNDQSAKSPITQLRIGRFENLIAWLVELLDQKSKQIELSLIEEVQQDWQLWWLDHCLYEADDVVVEDWSLMINRWINRLLLQMGQISKELMQYWDDLNKEADGGYAKVMAFMKDFSCDLRDDLNAKINRIDEAMKNMLSHFGEEIREKREVSKIQKKAKIQEKAKIVEWKEGDKKHHELNGVGFEMVYCPAGEFWMEHPKHKVKITKSFWMGETQVTQELWQAVMGWNPSHSKGSSKPIEMITWYDCLVFCNKLSELEKFTPCFNLTSIEKGGNHINKANVEWLQNANGYRLPTEAEWEYCAKAGTELIYSGSNSVDEVAWYHGNSGGKTYEVKTKKANGWGLYDMSGNVWEWCMDKWDENAYQGRNNGIENPILWDNSHCARVLRGGSYGNLADLCRVAYRFWGGADSRNYGWGFRLLRCEP